MKRLTTFAMMTALTLGMAQVTLAGEAGSSASAGRNGWNSGSASADAWYDGNGPGIAKTKTKSNDKISFGRAFAVGFDEHGLSFSASHAVASRFGPAAAGNFNMTIGLDGEVSRSGGYAIGGGSVNKNVDAGGFASSGPFGSNSGATAGASTGPGGFAETKTWSNTSRRFFRR
jgi:hypothetical protein